MSAVRSAGVVLRRLHPSAGLEQVNYCLSTPSKGEGEKEENSQRNWKEGRETERETETEEDRESTCD